MKDLPSAWWKKGAGRSSPSGLASRASTSASTTSVMKGRSSFRASARVSQLRKVSSPLAREKSSSPPLTRAASTRKKRASKRRGRPGGVMARKMNSSPSAAGWLPASKNDCQSAVRPRAGRVREGEAGFLPQFANCRHGQRLGQLSFGAQAQAPGGRLRQWACGGDVAILLVDGAAGEDELRRHEGRALAALTHQNARNLLVASDQDHRRGVAESIFRGLGVEHLESGGGYPADYGAGRLGCPACSFGARLRAGYPRSSKPCMRLAH